jgi:eukaryotic-like serine/threonine-protein kinase
MTNVTAMARRINTQKASGNVLNQSLSTVTAEVLSPAERFAPGAMVGPYRIVELLGAGGMGQVYRAMDTRLDRTVAIKLLHPKFALRPDARLRFEREARTISTLSHPHICTLFDVGQHGSNASW